MKKTFCFLLALILLLPLFSCSNMEEAAIGTTEPKTETAKKNDGANYPKVHNPLSWERINAIPVANADMTSDQLRQICLDLFRLSLTFQWTPANSYDYLIKDKKVTLGTNKVYAGVPYVAENAGGSFYAFLRYYDPETGVLDIGKAKSEGFIPTLGTHCSSGAFWGWARAVNSIPSKYATTMYHHEQGFLRVGPYRYFTAGDRWDREDNSTKNCCTANGQDVMFQSYAAIAPADGLLLVMPYGMHVRMAVSVTVVKNADGTINGDKSYVTYLDQGSSWEDRDLGEEGIVSYQGGVDETETFAKLYKTGYVPFTFGEFLGIDPVEKGEASIDLEGKATLDALKSAKLSSNYFLAEVRLTAYDDEGKITYETACNPGKTFCVKDMEMDRLLMSANTQKEIKAAVRVVIQAYLANGETVTIFDGKVL